MKCILSLVVFAFVAVGCQTTHADVPEHFAALDRHRGDDSVLKAVSPKGVVYRGRLEKHEPKADRAFWREALARKLVNDGYLIVKDEESKVAGFDGAIIHAVAPMTNGDYGFIVAFAPMESEILIAESAGARAELDLVMPEVLKAIAGIKVGH